MNRLPYVDRTGRRFRHVAQVGKDGSLLAVLEVVDGAPQPRDRPGVAHVDVTDLSLAKVDLFTSAEVITRGKAILDAAPPPPKEAPPFDPITLPAPAVTKGGGLG